jgi:hypothetical protein
MAGFVRATYRGTVLVQVARTSRAMTELGNTIGHFPSSGTILKTAAQRAVAPVDVAPLTYDLFPQPYAPAHRTPV